jgi:ribosome-associated protein
MNDVRKTPNQRDRKMQNILEAVDFSRKPVAPSAPLMEDPLIPMIDAIVNAADQRKATYMAAFRISSITEVTTFMVIIEGNSRPQNQAIALAVEDAVLLGFQQQPAKQGDAASGWILLDYGPVIVHVMTPQMRGFYKLEKRWKDAEMIDLGQLVVTPVGAPVSTDELSDGYGESDEGDEKDEEDPFWK